MFPKFFTPETLYVFFGVCVFLFFNVYALKPEYGGESRHSQASNESDVSHLHRLPFSVNSFPRWHEVTFQRENKVVTITYL